MPPDSDAPRADPPTPVERLGASPRGPILQRIRAYRLLWSLALITFVADQATKLWIVARVPYNPMHAHGLGHDIEVIRGFFYIIHVGNTGAAWSMFAGRSVLLACLAAGTLIAIYFWRHSLGLRDRISQISFGLLCGGITGNLVDRLLHQHVIDFIDLHFGSYIYPTFNIADSGICVGVILYLWQSLRTPAPGEEPPAAKPRSGAPPS
jgi:signal peptidase II